MFDLSRLFFEPKEKGREATKGSRCANNEINSQVNLQQEMELDDAYVMRFSHLWSRGDEVFEMVERA